MRRLLAGIATVGVMSLLLYSGVRRATPAASDGATAAAGVGSRSGAPNPAEERIHALLAGASNGDVDAYLAAFTGPIKGRLERDVAERGRPAFADDLRRAAATRKSHAVFAAEPDGDDAAAVTVESVYPDRNERQTYRVEKTGAGWLVAGVETVKSHQPGSRFGAPAVYVAPEGVPVQAAGGVSVETGDDDPRDP